MVALCVLAPNSKMIAAWDFPSLYIARADLTTVDVSFFFSVGLHPLGARWIQEHYLVHPSQETYSYYGPLNTIAFNVGYHNEHHDLPSIPWNHLPAVRQGAPELYNALVFHTSWTKLLFRFLLDPNITLFSRQVRVSRGGVALKDPRERLRHALEAIAIRR